MTRLASLPLPRTAAALILALALVGTPPAARGEPPLFDTWIGYDIGTYADGRFPYAAAAADLDGDGRPEILSAQWPWATGFSVIRNAGDGSYMPPARYASALAPLDLVVADLNGDGRQDVALPNTGGNWEGTKISVYRGQGDGTFTAAQEFLCGNGPVGLAAADFDGDTDTDLAVALYGYLGQGTTIALLRNNGVGGYLAPTTINVLASPYKLATGDLNHDGRPDLVVAHESGNYGVGGRISVLLSIGGGSFAPPVVYTTGLTHYAGDFYPVVVLVDADLDGDLDAFYTSSHTAVDDFTGAVVLFRNQGNGTFASPVALPSEAGWNLAASDVTGDGWPDVLGAGGDGVGWFVLPGNGAGGFLSSIGYISGEDPVAALPADADGDLDLDVLVVNRNSMEACVHPNPGNGDFSPPASTIAVPSNPAVTLANDMDAADVDGDQVPDVAIAYQKLTGVGGISVLLGAGDGSFPQVLEYPEPAQVPAFVKLRDLDGDGDRDLLYADDSPPYNFKTRRNSGGEFESAVSWTINSCGPGDIDAIDLDHDGDLDVVYSEALSCPGIPESGRQIFIRKNRGDGSFDPPYTVGGLLLPTEITWGDYNEDGHVDLALAQFYPAVGLLLGHGDGTFTPAVLLPVSQGPHGIVTGDLSDDGHQDLALCLPGGADLLQGMGVMLGRGDGTFGSVTTYLASYSPDLSGTTAIKAGDIDGDGDSDLLVTNYGSNDASIYRNHGDGTFDSQVRYGVGHSPIDFSVADFDANGSLDIAAAIAPGFSIDFRAAVSFVSGRATPAGLDSEAAKSVLELLPPAPNPFREGLNMSYRLPQAGSVRLTIHDLAGRRLATLVDGPRPAGLQRLFWSPDHAGSHRIRPGVYFLRLEADRLRSTRQVVLVE
jgi:hypothetical protein